MTLGLGVAAPIATAEPTLTVSFKTTQVGGPYVPKNVVAVWVQDSAGKFIKTIGRWADLRKNRLVLWQSKAGIADADAISGATRPDHSGMLTVTWDLKDKLGVQVPDGIYTLKMELADSDSTASGQNNQGTFTFTVGQTIEEQTALSNGGFTNVNIKFDPNANACNNNVVDPGETCDPPGSCPVDCAPSGDACAPNQLTGSAASCTALCAVVPVTACVNGDGCCAAGCTAANDTDCSSGDIGGGCSTSGDSNAGLIAFGLFGFVALASRRRR